MAVNWSALSWTGETPAGTTLGLSYRIGNTPTPDGSWTAFIPVSVSGGALTGNSRYIQYQAQLATADATQTPVLDDVTIFYSSGPDTTPPAISAVTATPGAGGTATITWTTDEPANSQVDYGTDSGSLTLDRIQRITGHHSQHHAYRLVAFHDLLFPRHVCRCLRQ